MLQEPFILCNILFYFSRPHICSEIIVQVGVASGNFLWRSAWRSEK